MNLKARERDFSSFFCLDCILNFLIVTLCCATKKSLKSAFISCRSRKFFFNYKKHSYLTVNVFIKTLRRGSLN